MLWGSPGVPTTVVIFEFLECVGAVPFVGYSVCRSVRSLTRLWSRVTPRSMCALRWVGWSRSGSRPPFMRLILSSAV